MIGQTRWRGEELVERGSFDFFVFAAGGSLGAGIEILRKEGAKIEFIEGIGGWRFGNFFRFFLEESFVGVAVAR